MFKLKFFSPAWIWLALILIISGSLMLSAARNDAATTDEKAHIPAGYGYVKYLDYRLNPEHPPLVKALSALPLAFLNLNFPTDRTPWSEDVNGQWAAGEQFLFESGNNPDQILFFSRLGPILLTLLLILATYLFSLRLLGRWWSLLPTTLIAFSPTILAHGHYVTTDVGAALGILLSLWAFVNFLERPNRNTLIIAGLAFGLAQLLKYSAILLIPFFVLIAIIHLARNSSEDLKNTALSTKLKYLASGTFKKLGSLITLGLIGTVLIYGVYFVFTVNYPTERQAADTEFTLTSFAGGPTPEGKFCNPLRCLAEADIWLSEHRLTQPLGEYLLGLLMVTQRSSGGNTGYFLGEVSAGGWPHYFPTVYLLKEPLPVLLLILTGLILALISIKRSWLKYGFRFREYLRTDFAEFSMLLFIIFYWAYSIRSPLNIGIRHILPTIPLIYILTASSLKKWITIPWNNSPSTDSYLDRFYGSLRLLARSSAKAGLIALLLVWFLAETAAAKPYYLSYFNQLGGGVLGGYRFVTDSNYDWGQDLKRLEAFAAENHIDKIAVDYFGGDSPTYRLGDRFVPWWSARNNPAAEDITWLAVSVNTLQSALARTAPGFERSPEDEYQWLKTARNLPADYTLPPPPDYRAGTSIFIYKLK